ncbi:MAG: TIGR02466 family protein [Gammaproteobacteria bacterium]
MPTQNQGTGIHQLWPTSILVRSNEQHASIKAGLLELFYEHRKKHAKTQGPVYASRDDLYESYKDHPAFASMVQFILDCVFELAAAVNSEVWKHSQGINVVLGGVWFQITNGGGFHETHVHGNCSWSGVYYVQAGESSRCADDKKDGLLNGVTRFYGPYMDLSAGGHAEFGNLYLQYNTWDSFPADGRLVVFPSYLKHMAYPYRGDQDRVIVSFHAEIHGERKMAYGYEFS